MQLEPEEVGRLDSWIATIAQELRPSPVMPTSEGLRIGRKGSLAVATTALWHDHQAGKGGRGALSLIQHLRQCDAAAAGYWAAAWLDAHPGLGDFTADTAAVASEAGERRAAFVGQVLTEATDPIGTPAEAYLRSRGLMPPYPECVRWLDDARLGEGAVVGVLTTETGEPVGCQLGYLAPTGQKSAAPPARQLFLLDREKAEQAAFRISFAAPIDGAAELAVAEGLEKALAVAQAGVGSSLHARRVGRCGPTGTRRGLGAGGRQSGGRRPVPGRGQGGGRRLWRQHETSSRKRPARRPERVRNLFTSFAFRVSRYRRSARGRVFFPSPTWPALGCRRAGQLGRRRFDQRGVAWPKM